MKSRCAALLVALAFLPYIAPRMTGQTATGQQAQAATPEQATTSFSTRSELVLVPAIVTDGSRHLTGLKKEDFTVLENGVAQKIAVFEEVTASNAVARKTPVAADGTFTNVMTGTPGARRINIIVLDMVNTQFADQAYAKREIIKFLERSAQSDQLTTLIAFSRNGVKVIHDFTTDAKVLAAALQKARAQLGAMHGLNEGLEAELNAGAIDSAAVAIEAGNIEGMMNAMEAESAQMMRQFATQWTLDALRDIARAYAGIPGRKSLIWVTGSFPFPITVNDDPRSFNFATRIQRILDELNSANISVYPVDARGLVTIGYTAAERVTINPRNPGAGLTARMSAHSASLDTMNHFADLTGGRAFYNTNDIAGAASRAAEDGAEYYVLSYYRQRKPDEKPGWHKLQVKVEHAHVRARSGFFVGDQPKGPEAFLRADIKNAVESPFDFTALPVFFRLNGTPAAGPDNKKLLNFDIGLNPRTFEIDYNDNNHASLEFVALARDESMKVADVVEENLQANLKPETVRKVMLEGMTYHSKLKLAPGEYSVRVIVRDNLSGKMGSLLAPVKVE